MTDKPTLIPPDGGWGWVIVGAQALNNFIMVPIMQSFGLLYRDRFDQLQMPATDISIIMNVNSAFGMSLGLFCGPLLRRFGYRRVALAGSAFLSVGVTLTSWAHSFTHFLVTYSIISSVGNLLLTSALSLAFNSYFRRLRSKAAGVSISVMGLGPVLVPQLITLLLRTYSTTGAAMIIGGLALHSFVASLLLQPVQWHMKPAESDATEQAVETSPEKEALAKPEQQQDGPGRRRRTSTLKSIDEDWDTASVYGWETPAASHRHFGSSLSISQRRPSTASRLNAADLPPPQGTPWWATSSLETVNLGSSVGIFDEKTYQPLPVSEAVPTKNQVPSGAARGCWPTIRRWLSAVSDFFDLDLLRDPTYVVLMLGMSIAICAELNFSLFTPLIMADYGFDKQQTATIMSILGTADIVFRFIAPFVGDFLGYSAQTMYLIAMAMLITTRTALMLYHDYTAALIVAVGLGVAKGFRTIYMTIVIPNYVPLEKLASANGLQMMVNSFFILASIPLMGFIKEATGSYNLCIGALNCLTLVTIIMWTTQIVVHRWRRRNTKNKELS